MLTSYYTIKASGSHEIVINKSRFITHMTRVTTEEEAQSFIEKIKRCKSKRNLSRRTFFYRKTQRRSKPKIFLRPGY